MGSSMPGPFAGQYPSLASACPYCQGSAQFPQLGLRCDSQPSRLGWMGVWVVPCCQARPCCFQGDHCPKRVIGSRCFLTIIFFLAYSSWLQMVGKQFSAEHSSPPALPGWVDFPVSKWLAHMCDNVRWLVSRPASPLMLEAPGARKQSLNRQVHSCRNSRVLLIISNQGNNTIPC